MIDLPVTCCHSLRQPWREYFILVAVTCVPMHFLALCLISWATITSDFVPELTHSGFALRAAPRATPGKNALFLDSTTVAESLVQACISFRLQLSCDQYASTFASWKRR